MLSTRNASFHGVKSTFLLTQPHLVIGWQQILTWLCAEPNINFPTLPTSNIHHKNPSTNWTHKRRKIHQNHHISILTCSRTSAEASNSSRPSGYSAQPLLTVTFKYPFLRREINVTLYIKLAGDIVTVETVNHPVIYQVSIRALNLGFGFKTKPSPLPLHHLEKPRFHTPLLTLPPAI